LRDFNIPKIVQDDNPVFFGLLGDLFPGIDVPRKRDMAFEAVIENVAKESGMYADPEFILKIVQLGELLQIRHCVFTMGPPASGKSTTWRMLAKAQDKEG
jgi:dynein heavy chain